MRVAVISDVHGFLPAFRRVLKEIDAAGPWDGIYLAGDLAEKGPCPAETVDLIRERGIACVMGNTDLALVRGARPSGESDPEIEFARGQLGPERIDWLATLPFSLRVTPPGGSSPDDDLLIVHANPEDLDQPLYPQTGDATLQRLFGPVRAGAVAFGHIHIPWQRTWNEMLLVNVAAVGNPKDGDLRSTWAEFAWAGDRWEATLHRVDYPLKKTVALLHERGVPNADKQERKLRRANYRFDPSRHAPLD